MHCKHCDYALWNLRDRICPECGNAFLPSEYEFVPNSIRFCCTECGQDYYGVDDKGHLVPTEFDCVRCGSPQRMDDMLVLPTEGVTEEQALLLGDVTATGYFCAEQAGIHADGIYAVVGCGPVGIMAVIGARHLGAEMIYAVDTIPERLELARKAGAVPIDFNSEDPVLVLHDAAEGRGADAVMEAVGSFASHRSAIELVRPGGTISSVGVHTETAFAFTPAEAYDKNLTYKVGRCPARVYMERLAPFVRDGQLDISGVISHRFPLERGPEAYRLFDERRDQCTKVLLTP
ncbi:MAG: zinc-binding dehydrogenase [Planctomycetes bacterium]|nr:zinc-binding dehydrogenase [Planctomycetota bacterium]